MRCLKNEPELGCFETECSISMHNIDVFKKQTQNKIPVKKMATFITVRGIGSDKHTTDKYAIINIH